MGTCWEAAALADRAADLAGLWYLGDRFGRRVLDHYRRLVPVAGARLAERVRWFRVARELAGVAWSVRNDDAAELAESVGKLRAVLPLAAGRGAVGCGQAR